MSYGRYLAEQEIRRINQKMDALVKTGSIGIFIILIGLLVGNIITILAGNDWQVMKESPFWMTLFILDTSAMWYGLIMTIVCAVKYNILDAKY